MIGAGCGLAGRWLRYWLHVERRPGHPVEEITFGGAITQSTQDGTGPAVINPSLNGVKDGDSYTVTLDFPGPLTSPRAFDPLAGATLTFLDAAAGASESAFNMGQNFCKNAVCP